MVDNPEAIYMALKEYLNTKLKPVFVEHTVWLDDPNLLREEMEQTANKNCGLDSLETVPLDDWQSLLSENKMKNYQGYLSKLEMDDIPVSERPLRLVAVAQDPVERPMQSTPGGVCCAFTSSSTTRLMITNKNRWLTAIEKAAMFGFPVHEDWVGAW